MPNGECRERGFRKDRILFLSLITEATVEVIRFHFSLSPEVVHDRANKRRVGVMVGWWIKLEEREPLRDLARLDHLLDFSDRPAPGQGQAKEENANRRV